MSAGKTVHIPVLAAEVLEALRAGQGGEFLDCTLGGAGHTSKILEANPRNRVVAIDRDIRAIERARERLAEFSERVRISKSDFLSLEEEVGGSSFDGMLADLGLSSDQLKEGRGFSFNDDQALDMRMDEESGLSAAQIVNSYSQDQIFKLLKQGGVGQEAYAASKAIVENRPFSSSAQLARAINQTLAKSGRGKSGKKVNPSTVIFQAIRMAVNNELAQIESLMNLAPRVIKQGGRMAVITFHSLEDRAVTRKMREWESGGEYSAHSPGARASKKLGRMLDRKGIQPCEQEISSNPSARSAKLRVFEFSTTE